MAANDIYRASIKSFLHGTRCVNVFHYREETPPGGGLPEADLASAIEADLLPKLLAILSQQVSVHCIEIVNVTNPGGNPYILYLDANNVGLVLEDALPANKALCAALYTAEYNANGRGRKYFSGIPGPWEVDNALAVDAKPGINALELQLVADLEGGDQSGVWQHVVYSNANELGYTVVKAIVGPQVHSLRGRTAARC